LRCSWLVVAVVAVGRMMLVTRRVTIALAVVAEAES
jgi:hypothetical protein